MSIQGEIDRLKGNVSAAYAAVQEKGGTIPTMKSSDNLPAAIRSISAEEGEASIFPAAGTLKVGSAVRTVSCIYPSSKTAIGSKTLTAGSFEVYGAFCLSVTPTNTANYVTVSATGCAKYTISGVSSRGAATVLLLPRVKNFSVTVSAGTAASE